MEQNKEIVQVESTALQDVVQKSVAVGVENAQLKAENEKLQEVVKSFDSKLENIEKSYKADAEELKTAMLSIKKSSRGSGFGVAHSGEGESIDIIKSTLNESAQKIIKGETYSAPQNIEEFANMAQARLLKKSNLFVQHISNEGVFNGEEAILKTIRTTDMTSNNGVAIPTLISTIEEMEKRNALVNAMPTYVLNGTTSAYLIRQNEFGDAVITSEDEDLPSGFESGINFKKEEAKMLKYTTNGKITFEAGTVSAASSQLVALLRNVFPRTITTKFGKKIMARTKDMNNPGFIPFIDNIGTSDNWSYDVNYVKSQQGLSDNSLVFDKDGRVGYIRSGAAGSFTYDNIVDLIASVVDGDTTGYAMVMSPSTAAYCVKMKFTDTTYLLDRNAIMDRNPILLSIASIPIIQAPFMEPIGANKMPIMLVRLNDYMAVLKSSQEYLFEDRTQNQSVRQKYFFTTFLGTKLLSGNAARGLLLSA